MDQYFLSDFKGQSAIDYMMNYGWMLIVVALIGSAIFSVFQSSSIESISGFSGEAIDVKDVGLTPEGDLKINIRNTASEEVEVKSVELIDSATGATTRINPSTPVPVGSAGIVEMYGFERSTSTNEQEIKITYDKGDLKNLIASGTITGKIKARNHVYIQEAGYNLSKNSLSVDIENRGSSTAEEVSLTVKSDEKTLSKSITNLGAGESRNVSVKTNKTFPLEDVNLDVEGDYFSDSDAKLSCATTENLKAYFPMNRESTENKWTKHYSEWNNGSMDGDIPFNDTDVGEGFYFDGEDNSVRVEHEDGLGLNKSFTVAMSLNKPFNARPYIDKGCYRPNHVGNFHGRWQVRGGGNLAFAICNGTEVQGIKWRSFTDYREGPFHVAAAYNSSQFSFYGDGFLREQKENPIEIKQVDWDMMIGGRVDWGGHRFKGTIDEVRIYNEHLSADEIQRIEDIENRRDAIDQCRIQR
jgi:predicted transport protein